MTVNRTSVCSPYIMDFSSPGRRKGPRFVEEGCGHAQAAANPI